MDDLNTNIARVIKQLRHEKKLTQKDLSEKSGISLSTIERIERGTHIPQSVNLKIILDSMSTSLEDFFSLVNGTNMALFNSDIAQILDASLERNYSEVNRLVAILRTKPYCNIDIPLVEQTMLMLEGNFLSTQNNDYQSALETYFKAFTITINPKLLLTPNKLDYKYIADYKFTMNEYSILKGIANSIDNMGETEKAIDLYLLVLQSLESNSTDYEIKKVQLPVFYFNISNMFNKLEQYSQSFEMSNKGIDFSKKSKNLRFISHLRWNKGKSLFYLGNKEEATKSFEASYEGFKDISHNNFLLELSSIAKNQYDILLK